MPILISIFIYLNFKPQVIEINNTKIIDNEIKKYKQKIKLIEEQKYTNNSTLEIINSYENIALKLKVNITDLQVDKNIVILKYKANYQNAIKYLNFIDKISRILSFEIAQASKFIIVTCKIDIDNSKDIKTINISKLKDIKNPFKTNKKIKSIKTKAISDNFVMLDGKWYQLNDKYQKSIIVKISQNYIVLKNKNKTTILKVFDNE